MLQARGKVYLKCSDWRAASQPNATHSGKLGSTVNAPQPCLLTIGLKQVVRDHSTPPVWAGGKFCNSLTSFGPFQVTPVSTDDLLCLNTFVWEMSPFWNLSPPLTVTNLQLHPSTILNIYRNGKETLTLCSRRTKIIRYFYLLTSLPFAWNTRLHLKSWYVLGLSKASSFLATGPADRSQTYGHLSFWQPSCSAPYLNPYVQ